MKLLGLASWIALWILCISCSDPRRAGDPNSSETENMLSVRLQNPAGQPLALARVDLYAAGLIAPPVVSAQANDQGLVQFEKPDSGSYYALASTTQYATYRALSSSPESVWTAPPRTSWQLQLGGEIPADRRVCLPASPFCAQVDSAGVAHFSDIAQGLYQIQSTQLQVDSNANPGWFYQNQGSIVLEDFQIPDTQGNLASWTGGSQWWLHWVDSATSVPAHDTLLTAFIQTDSTSSTRFIRIQANIPRPSQDFVLLGLNMGLGYDSPTSLGAFADLATMDSLCIQVRGTGIITVFMQTQSVLALGDEQHFYQDFTLTGNWQTVVITPMNLQTYPSSLIRQTGISPVQALSRTSAVVLQMPASGQYDIGAMELFGVQGLSLHSGS